MIHDKLCPAQECESSFASCSSCDPAYESCRCVCDLLQQARYDEAEQIAARINAYANKHHEPHDPGYACIRCDITAAYRLAAKMAGKVDRGTVP